MADSLNPKHLRFIQAYAASGNGKQAAIDAGYSVKRAASTACNLMKNPRIVAAIQRAGEERGKSLDITAERLDQALAKIAFDTTGAVKDGDRIQAITILNKTMGRLTDRVVTNTEDETLRIELGDMKPAAALRLAGSA